MVRRRLMYNLCLTTVIQRNTTKYTELSYLTVIVSNRSKLFALIRT